MTNITDQPKFKSILLINAQRENNREKETRQLRRSLVSSVQATGRVNRQAPLGSSSAVKPSKKPLNRARWHLNARLDFSAKFSSKRRISSWRLDLSMIDRFSVSLNGQRSYCGWLRGWLVFLLLVQGRCRVTNENARTSFSD